MPQHSQTLDAFLQMTLSGATHVIDTLVNGRPLLVITPGDQGSPGWAHVPTCINTPWTHCWCWSNPLAASTERQQRPGDKSWGVEAAGSAHPHSALQVCPGPHPPCLPALLVPPPPRAVATPGAASLRPWLVLPRGRSSGLSGLCQVQQPPQCATHTPALAPGQQKPSAPRAGSCPTCALQFPSGHCPDSTCRASGWKWPASC